MSQTTVGRRRVEEIIKCGKDPVYFFNNYVKIQHPVKGLVGFETYPFQDECTAHFIKHRFNIVLKSRQLGLSTLSAAYAVWLAIFKKDQTILIIATKQKVAQNMVKKIKTIIMNLPPDLMIASMVANNRQEIEFSNGSTIKAIPTSDDAGRSEALSLLIIDEAAFIKNFDELWKGLYSTLSTGGRAIVLSTPNGVGNKYHELYSDAEAGLNQFNPIKLPWQVHPDRDQAWYDKESRNMKPQDVAQELNCDFLSSGDTFIGSEQLGWVTSLIRPPIKKMGPDNNVWVWMEPAYGHRYILSADVSRGDAKDYSTFSVIDVMTGEQVAEYKGKMRPDKFADLVSDIGKYYNTAVVCPESNVYGYAVCTQLHEQGYKRLYYQDCKNAFTSESIPHGELSKAGFNTSGRSRPMILGKLEEQIRNKVLHIYSSRFLDELKTFVWISDKAQAMSGRNDDLIMSVAIGAWLLDIAGGNAIDTSDVVKTLLKGMGKVQRALPQQRILGTNFSGRAPNGEEFDVSRNGDMMTATRKLRWLF